MTVRVVFSEMRFSFGLGRSDIGIGVRDGGGGRLEGLQHPL